MTEFDSVEWHAAVERHRARAVPAARQMRTLSDDEAAGLLSSIGANGQLAPVLVLEDGQLVDGVHRSAACELLGIETATTTVEPDDADRMAVELNAARRQMSVYERAQAASDYAAHRGVTIEEAARVWSVAERHISRVRRVVDHGDQEVIEELRKGSISVGAAEEMVAQVEREREYEADRLRRIEEQKPLLIDATDQLPTQRKKLIVLTGGAKVDEIVKVVDELLRSGTRSLLLRSAFGTDHYYGAEDYLTWKAPAQEQDKWAWQRKTIHARGCIDQWKAMLPEWREEEQRIRVSRAAAKELGLPEGEHPRETIATAVEAYAGTSIAVKRLEDQVVAA